MIRISASSEEQHDEWDGVGHPAARMQQSRNANRFSRALGRGSNPCHAATAPKAATAGLDEQRVKRVPPKRPQAHSPEQPVSGTTRDLSFHRQALPPILSARCCQSVHERAGPCPEERMCV